MNRRAFAGSIALWILYSCMPVPAQISPSERAALIALYHSADGAHWRNNKNWLGPEGTECQWHGVQCSGSPSYAVERLWGLAIDRTNNMALAAASELDALVSMDRNAGYHYILSGADPEHATYERIPGNAKKSVLAWDISLFGEAAADLAPGSAGSPAPAAAAVADELFSPYRVTVDRANNRALVSNDDLEGVIAVDLATGVRAILANAELPFVDTMRSVVELNLSQNRLNGGMPAEFGNLTNLTRLHLSGNQLRGSIPSGLGSLAHLSDIDLSYNALYSDHSALTGFLDSKQTGWQNTQTVSPGNVHVFALASGSIQVSWDPIAYTSDNGRYEVLTSQTSGGPYAPAGSTDNKSQCALAFDSLTPGGPLYFVVRAVTDPHANNSAALASEFSGESFLKSRRAFSADFNGDSSPDILWRNGSTGEALVWFMDGEICIGSSLLLPAQDLRWKIEASVDFNGDGRSDIVWRNVSTGENLVWFMDGAEKIGDSPLSPVPDPDWFIAGAADFNRDGKPDLLWCNVSTGMNYIWFMDGAAHVDSAFIAGMGEAGWEVAGLNDFNGDGQPDILWRNRSTGENRIDFMNGTVLAGGARLDAVVNLNWKIVSTGDYNGDGHQDILWRNTSTGENYVWHMNGAARAGDGFIDPMADLNWSGSDSGGRALGLDFDYNGSVDLLWRNRSTGENYVWYMDRGNWIGGDALDTVADVHWTIAGIADFDRDGRVDLLWRHSETGENLVWFMNGKDRIDGALLEPAPDVSWKIAGMADFNGDGQPDILWRNNLSGENYVWFMSGTLRTGGAFLPSVEDLNWKIVGTGDFNGNGKAEIVWRNEATGENYFWHMEGTDLAGGGHIEPVSDPDWKIAGIADFNQDRQPDILWRNKATGDNCVWFMNGSAHVGDRRLPPVAGQDWQISPASE